MKILESLSLSNREGIVARVFFVLFGVLPLAAGFFYAAGYAFGIWGALNRGFTLHHWQRLLSDGGFWWSLLLSLLMAVCVCALSVLMALRLLPFMLPFWEKRGIRPVFYLPLALPPLAAAVWSLQFLGNRGLAARMAHALGCPEGRFPALVQDALQWGIGSTLTLMTFPFLLIVLLGYYESARVAQLSDMAATLGADARCIRRRVQYPVLLWRIAPTLMLSGIFLFGAFEVPLLLGRQYPAMISVYIDQKFSRFNLDDVPLAYCATVVYSLVTGAVSVFFLRHFRSK